MPPVTLQYCEDVADIKKTILELREAVVVDFYPEAILQKYNILQVRKKPNHLRHSPNCGQPTIWMRHSPGSLSFC
jgi:hypothetical protein